MDICQNHPDEAWPLVQALVDASRDNNDLGFVAAGPIEDLLRHHGDHIIERIEAAASGRPAFRLALSGVWPSSIPPSVWDRVVRAVGDGPGLDG